MLLPSPLADWRFAHPVTPPCVCVCARTISVADKVSDHPSDAEDASYAEDQPLADDGSVITTVYRPDDGSLEFVLDGNSLGIAFARSVPTSFTFCHVCMLASTRHML